MKKNKTKNELMSRNNKILTEIIPKYLNEVEQNNQLLKQELKEWESITTKGNNPYNMKQHLNKLNNELDQWRNLIPGKHTIKSAKKYLNQGITKTTKSITNDDIAAMEFYNTSFIDEYGIQYQIKPFVDINDFIKAKKLAIKNITDPDIDTLTKVVKDKYYFIKYFEHKKFLYMNDKDFNVNDIEQYTKW